MRAAPADSLAFYTRRLTQLKRNSAGGHGAPYKPALLLAVLEGVENGTIGENEIRITPELIAAFRATCRLLNTSPLHRDYKLDLPFYHLSTEKAPFWHLHTRAGLVIPLSSSNSFLSARSLRAAVDYAWLDPDLWALATDAVARETLRQTLLQRYFPTTAVLYRPNMAADEVARLGRQMVEESAAEYVHRFALAPPDDDERLVRGVAFKREVLMAYGDTCAISGLRLTTAAGAVPLLDACHIVPWAASYDDTLPNGLALCPNLHRAFDRHLLWVDDDYRVRLADSFGENGAYGIRQFEGKMLKLPEDGGKRPGRENFRRQRGEI